MPGAITNPMLNPEQAWMDFHPNQNVQIYRDAVAKGFVYGGGDNWTVGGTPKTEDGGVPGSTFNAGGSGGFGGPKGLGGSSGAYGSYLSGTQFGGKNPFATDAAAAKLRDEFARLKKSGASAMNEDLSARGIFSSGVGSRLASEQQTQYGLQEAAALEDLYNKSAQQQMAYDLEMQRMKASHDLEMQRMKAQQMSDLYSGGSQRFGDANANQQAYESYGYSSKGSGGGQYPSTSGGFSGGTTGIFDTGYVGSPSWKAEQARIKAILDAREAAKNDPYGGVYQDEGVLPGQSF